ncbi:hypothetical protein B0A54_06988 [Friedmanniomyces endolithicus]|uniref:PXA domain-containing protein n=1 Tax=Friedmanniomyces endolithicus TaxID=329885 RepID=A0A4U0V3F2_9PEZI|nr:tRNA (guanine-N(7)-)-methyltransferase (tRNA(m7G46)-methyltransferase) [Friedmanniomyces endolithicus]TKA42772.1 hypothetical protein B0A54_06988 [Friedmanniomyces endolithicus]
MNLERKHVIAAAIVAFVAWTLLADWIPSLRWVPYAVLTGFLAAVLGLLYLILTTSKGTRHSEDAYADDAPLAPAFSRGAAWEEATAALRARAEYRRPTIFPEARAFSKAVDGLLDLILRDYVTSWYGAISSRPLFQHEIDRCLRSVLLTVAAKFTEIDVVEVGVARILPMVTAHLKEFYDAERVVRGKDLAGNVTESEELDYAVASKYRDGKLHDVSALAQADVGRAQQEHLRTVVVKVLPSALPANMQSSKAVTVLTREIVTCAVLRPIFTMLCDPDFWNQQIVSFGGPMLQDRKTVKRVRAALDQHSPAPSKTSRSTHAPRLKAYDSERQFERFIRAIRHLMNLSEARRCRSEIVSQIRRDSAVEGQDAIYLRRLETGKRLLDQKIVTLSATGTSKPKLSVRTMSSAPDATARKQRASLREVIYDSAGLSYYMEYMDRAQLMRLVQFYLVADGFRYPLEGDSDDAPPGVAEDPDRMDIAQMYESYLSQPELQTAEAALVDVQSYLRREREASLQEYLAARRAVLRTQTRVYNLMKQTHFENFRKSDLYYKWLAIDDSPAQAAMQSKQSKSTLTPDSAASSDTSPVKARRPQPPNLRKEPELRRAVLSSSDLRISHKLFPSVSEPRRSLDDMKRPVLFDDEVENEQMMQSLTSLKEDESDGDSVQRAQEEDTIVREMQTALDDIVGHEQDTASLFSDSTGSQSLDVEPHAEPPKPVRPVLSTRSSNQDRPSIASLGLVGAPSTRGVFVDDLFAEEAHHFAEDEREDSNGPEDSETDPVQHAAPGDLGLAEAIHVLSAEIDKLNAQKGVLDSLTAKAELTNNAAELRILRKSEQSLQREIKRKDMQKQQYAVQEGDNDLYGRAQVTIKSVMIGQEDDGHEYALYVIEVCKQAGDSMPAATWAVTRRYSQFHELHKRLRTRFQTVRDLDFPRRQALFTLQRDFIQKRRVILERYLRSLLLVPAICRSRELRAFLSQAAIAADGTHGPQIDTKDFVSRIYNSVSDGMEEFLGNIHVLDQLSVAGQNLISAASAQMNVANSIDVLGPATHDPATASEAETELNAYEAKEAEPFVKPICDLFLETFELSKGNSWLRGRTVVVVLHQLLGGTIERKVREGAKNALQDVSLARYVGLLRDTMWPGGLPRPASTPRTAAEKARTRREAGLILGALVPDLAGSVVGKTNALAASRKMFAVVNNRRLNAHFVFTLLDEIVKIVFPETLQD